MNEEQRRALGVVHHLTLTPANLRRIEKQFSVEVARWAFEQVQLRKRAKGKFARAQEMLFVAEALEQATHEQIAAYHASLFPVGVLVADLTASIGADLIALARRGPAIGFDLSAERLECAQENLRLHQAQAMLVHGDSLFAADGYEYAFVDPARRVDGKRTLNPEDFSPSPVEISRRLGKIQLALMKLTPLLADRFLEELAPSVRFLSFGGECREVLLAMGRQAQKERLAVHVSSGEELPASEMRVPTEQPATYLYDADPAAVRANALGTLARRFNLELLGDSNGYLTGAAGVHSPWLRSYRVLYSGKGDEKATQRVLREQRLSVFEVKQRAVGQEPAPLLKRFRGDGKSVSLVLYPVGRSVRHLLVEAVP